MKKIFLLMFHLLLIMSYSSLSMADTKKKILVVMSYHPSMTWQQQIKQGLESKLKNSELKYFYLDTKRNRANGANKAKEAYRLYQQFQPDGVITVDDHAQSLFAVPYLKDKVKTPVVFCGVNNSAEKYGFPASNVTGVIEKKHLRESISLLQLIDQSFTRMAVIYSDNTSNRTNLAQIISEKDTYSIDIIATAKVSSIVEVKKALGDLNNKVDAFYIFNLTGLDDSSGNKMDGAEVTAQISAICNKPTMGYAAWAIKSGLLCGVVNTGNEQGSMAAQMLLDIFNGKPLNSIPIAQNRNGQRIINVTTAARLKLKLNPRVLIGTRLVN